MATWEDGPEYAPRVRPDAFSPAEVAPLEPAPPVTQPAAGAPTARPHFSAPGAPVAPLAALVPAVEQPRNPSEPFAVVTSTLTSADSAWGAAHWNVANESSAVSRESTPAFGGYPPDASSPFPPAGAPASYPPPLPGSYPQPPATGPYPVPAPPADPWGAAPVSWPAPTAPVPPLSGPPSLPGGYPPPGTDQWFGPGPVTPQQPAPEPPHDLRAVFQAATPGLCICLLVGGLVPPLAPILLVVAFVLSKRVQVAQQTVRRVFGIALGFLALLSMATLVLGDRLWFTDWWDFVGRCGWLECWVVLLSVVLVVGRGLRSGSPRPPTSGYTSNWG